MLHKAVHKKVTPAKNTGAPQQIPEGGILAAGEVTNEIGWYPISVRGPSKSNFVQLVEKQIREDPFFGIYRIVDTIPYSGQYIYLYMKDTIRVRALLNSPEMGAATTKKQEGTTPVTVGKPVHEDVINRHIKNMPTSAKVFRDKDFIKKCMLQKDTIREEAIYAIRQIEEDLVRIAEVAQVNLRITNFGGDIEENLFGEFNIEYGYLYGLVQENDSLHVIDESTAKSTGVIDPIKITTNLMDIAGLMEPVVKSDKRVVQNLGDVPGLIDVDGLTRARSMINAEAKSVAEAYVRDRKIDFNYTAYVKQEDLIKYGASPEEEEAAQEEDIERENELVQQVDNLKEEGQEPSYKILQYGIRVGQSNVLHADTKVEINGEVIGIKVHLENMTLKDIITAEGMQAMMEDAIAEVIQYLGSAPFAQNKLASVGGVVSEDVSYTDAEALFIRIYNIDTNKLLEANS